MPNVDEMLRASLEQLGADGLCNGCLGCGCELADLAPCGDYGLNCEAAKLDPSRAASEGVDFWMVPIEETRNAR